ncbi:MAG TPA: hypothetical protein VHO47_02200 [Candidatus Babeliales bacterium]|nr:hypothetical protein [Candidatus Babeliales bacterium]
MNKNNKPSLLFVTYDGISNSVFESQVLEPLKKYQNNHPDCSIHIISFERVPKKFGNYHSPFKLIVLKKIPYIGKFSLIPAIMQLKKVLKKYTKYSLIARGPLAGYICKKAAQKTRCVDLTIQARGLLAEEYAFTHKDIHFFTRSLHALRTQLYKKLEHTAYAQTTNDFQISIEAVSTALKDYLIKEYKAPALSISIAHGDIPSQISSEKKIAWRGTTRSRLLIDPHAKVYCYNGSAKAWQCPEETIIYFKKMHELSSDSFLLILTNEPTIFEALCKKNSLAVNAYRILNVAHNEIYQYLAAADVGIIVREPHIINWTSRPTKLLEYQAVGLQIVHNNTIEMLVK